MSIRGKQCERIGCSPFQPTIAERLPPYSALLFDAKASKGLSFEEIARHLDRSEVAVAALFYGQATASAEDVDRLSQLLDVSKESLAAQLTGFPDRGRAGPMPPVEPLIYRLYEIVQNYGYAYKAILNEKFGDGIMSAICFSTKVEKEVDEAGAPWVVITLKGKWYVWIPRLPQSTLCTDPVQAAFHEVLRTETQDHEGVPFTAKKGPGSREARSARPPQWQDTHS